MVSREIGALLKQKREERGISACEAAKRAGVPRMTVYRLERGIVHGSLESYNRIAEACGLKIKITVVADWRH